MSSEIRISDAGNENLIEDIRREGVVYAYDESIAMVDWKRDSDLRTDPSRPMWEVYLDGTSTTGRLLHSTGVDDSSRYVIGGRLSLAISEPGSFSFTITPHHILYDEIIPYHSTVTVYQEGVELFRGRVTSYTTDIQRQRQVECEGDLSYLADIQISSNSIERDEKKLSKMFEYFVNLYNTKGELSAGDIRYIAPGEVSISKADYNVEAYKWITPDDKDYKDVREYIDEFIDCFGGYLRTKRYADGLVHLEYISGYTEVNNQTITYGENLLELSISSEFDDLFTVMIVSAEEFTDGNGNKSNPKINKIAAFTDSTVCGATIRHTASTHTLVWEEGLATYGRIIREQSFSGIRNANELKNCFRQNSKQEAIEQFKQYLQDYRVIPVVLKDFIRKHIIMHFHRYVEHLDDENIEKTSNKVDNYYRQTNPEKIKKLFKTKNGILTFLDFQMQNWTQNHIKIK